MSKSARLAIGSVLVLITLAVVFLLLRPKPVPLSDLEFTQMAFAALMRGDSNAESFVDFENLSINVMKNGHGDDYLALQSEDEKARFRAAFVAEFVSSMKVSGIDVKTVNNWMVTSADSMSAQIGANAPNNVGLSLTILKRNGERKISEVQISLH